MTRREQLELHLTIALCTQKKAQDALNAVEERCRRLTQELDAMEADAEDGK